MKHLALALLAFLFYSCSTTGKKYEMKIDVDRAFNQKKEVKLSSLVKNLEYIPLETDSNSLLDEIKKLWRLISGNVCCLIGLLGSLSKKFCGAKKDRMGIHLLL